MKQHSLISQSINSLKALLALSAIFITSPSFAQNSAADHIHNAKSATYDYATGQGLITLESYVDGEIEEKGFTKASDIVLVLDVSNSMCPYNTGLTTSVKTESLGRRVKLFGGDKIGYLHTGTASTNDTKTGDANYGKNHDWKTTITIDGKTTLRYTIQLGGSGTLYNLAYLNGAWKYSTGTSTTSGTWTTYTANSANDIIYTDVKLDLLENACRDLIDIIGANPPTSGSHRISIVTYAQKTNPVFNLGLTALTGSNIDTMKDYVTFMTTAGSTYAKVGLDQAINNLSGSTGRDKLILFFTDGEPNNKFYEIINSAKTLKDGGAKIFSVGLVADETKTAAVWNTPETNISIKQYLEYVSSLYPNANGTLSSNKSTINAGTKNTDLVEYYHNSDGDDLSEIFKMIGGMAFSGGAGAEDLDAEDGVYLKDRINMDYCVLVDTDASKIKTYTAACTGKDASGSLTFAARNDTTLTVKVNSSTGSQSIDVEGFDYSKNWCGYNAKNSEYHGRKLIVTIPFKMKAPGDGTFDLAKTNLAGSSLYKGDEPVDGASFPIPEIPFTEVTIKKYGLKAGDSAVYIVKKDDVEITRVVLTGTDDSGTMVSTKLRILEPNVEYSVTETWWDYTYTLTSSDPDVTNNVFIFNSEKRSGMENEAEHRKVNEFYKN